MKKQILIADDEEVIRRLLAYNVEKLGASVVLASNGREAIELMTEEILVALIDLKMPLVDGMGCLKHFKEKFPDTPVIMISAAGQVKDAVMAMKQGAFEYVTKPFDLDELVCVVQQAMRLGRSLRETNQLKSAFATSQPAVGFVGASAFTSCLLQQVARIAPLQSTILISGESGTGKSLLARTIHYSSPRAREPFVSVSCPSLPRELIESEMFGHEKGAFTGALQRRLGRVETAEGGTLFLDEIGDLSLHLQPKLLTFLQERRFQRIGGSEVLEADVRVIAATNVDLQEKIRAREFREDLYFRLNVFSLHLEPLRKRTDDIPPLTTQILQRIQKERGCEPLSVEPEALDLMLAHSWPGNVRELENVLERASAFCEGGIIRVQQLPLEINAQVSSQSPETTSGAQMSLAGLPLEEIEKAALQQTLKLCRGNKSEAARRLGITEKTIYNKLKRHGLR
ncbi:MAG: sigma-54-dependent Fis family transcriptional regulator [Verrucomicrobia bacterium]|nr:sigma-54-dependent Fis family transcriptional regulator [Verrucomicrobiota bacterium]